MPVPGTVAAPDPAAGRDRVRLDGRSLSVDAVCAVAAGAPVEIAPDALARMGATRAVLEELLARGEAVYGLTTGVAERKAVRVDAVPQAALQRRLLANHRVASGPEASGPMVRAAMCCLANELATGYPGARPELARWLAAAINAGELPAFRTLGSVGQADLGALAELAGSLLSIRPLELAAGEALALIDNNACSTAAAALAVGRAGRLLEAADGAAALSLEAFAANLSALHEAVAAARPHPGLATARRRIAALLAGGALGASGAARNLQDPLSFRCVPQVHGTAHDALGSARRVLEVELNAAQGNPIVVLEERRAISAGNFDAAPLATALDLARNGLATLAGAASERAVKLLQPTWSGLPAGLAVDPASGDDGLAELAVAAQSLAVELRLLAQPVAFELVSTAKAEGIEDRTAMAWLGARRLDEQCSLLARLLAVELVVAAQAVELRAGGGPDRLAPAGLGAGTATIWRAVRSLVPFTAAGEPVPDDLDPLAAGLEAGVLYPRSPASPPAEGDVDG